MCASGERVLVVRKWWGTVVMSVSVVAAWLSDAVAAAENRLGANWKSQERRRAWRQERNQV